MDTGWVKWIGNTFTGSCNELFYNTQMEIRINTSSNNRITLGTMLKHTNTSHEGLSNAVGLAATTALARLDSLTDGEFAKILV